MASLVDLLAAQTVHDLATPANARLGHELADADEVQILDVYQAGKKSDSYYQHGTFRTRIAKIVKADPKILDKLKNKEDFKDFVPYFIFSETEILTYTGKTDGNPPTPPILYGVLKDGKTAGKAIGFGGLQGCDSEYFDGPVVGASSTNCTVVLGPKAGAAVVGVAFEGDNDIYPKSDENPYIAKPVLWLP